MVHLQGNVTRKVSNTKKKGAVVLTIKTVEWFFFHFFFFSIRVEYDNSCFKPIFDFEGCLPSKVLLFHQRPYGSTKNSGDTGDLA